MEADTGKRWKKINQRVLQKTDRCQIFIIRITHVLDTMNVPTIVGVKMKCYPPCFWCAHISNPTASRGFYTNDFDTVTSHQVVQVLLAWRGEVNGRDYDGETPLHLAVKLGDVELAGLLPWQTDSDGWEF